MPAIYIILLSAYILFMVGMAVWFSRPSKVKDGEDFVLAGKSLSVFVLSATLLATFVGSGSIVGGANFVFTYGPLAGIFFFSGTFIGIICLFFLSPIIRKNGFRTVPELLHSRFGTPTRILGTIVIVFAFVGITAYNFTSAGQVVAMLTPMSPTQGTILATILIALLAVSGGLKSVAWTDAASAVLIVAGLFGCLVYVFINDVGSIGTYVDSLAPEARTWTGGLSELQLLGYFLPLFLLILGDQNMHQRLAAAKDVKTAAVGTVLFFIGAVLILAPIVLLASFSSFLTPDIDADMAVLGIAGGDLTTDSVGGVLLVSAFALIITTGSSYLLASSSSLVYDVVFPNRPKAAGSQKGVLTGRLAVVALTAFAFVMVQFFPTVLSLQMYAYTMYGAALTPVILAALLWKRATASAALATILVGGGVTVFWEATGRSGEMNAVLVSLPAAVITLVVVSLSTKPHGSFTAPDASSESLARQSGPID